MVQPPRANSRMPFVPPTRFMLFRGQLIGSAGRIHSRQSESCDYHPCAFERDLLRGRTSPVQMLADGSDANTASLVAGYVTSIVNAYNASHSGQTNLQPVKAEIRLWFNPGLDSLKFTGPGVFVLCHVHVRSPCSRVWQWQRKARRRPSFRFMRPTSRRLNSSWARSSHSLSSD